MIEALLGAIHYQKSIDQMLIIGRHIFQLILIEIILLVIFNAIELYLNKLRRSGPALCGEVGNHFSFIDLGNALDGERPKDLLTDHHKDLAFVHTARVGDEREGDF